MVRDLLSTGEAAKICSVTPNTVLKWIKSGRLPAQRTPGGHYRIDPRDLARRFPLRKPEGPVYCWEHNALSGEVLEECRDCLVYRARALRCYQLTEYMDDSERLCENLCEDCDYFRMVLGQGDRVAVLVEDPDLAADFREQLPESPFRIEIATSEYALGRLVQEYAPDFLVIDCPSGVERAERLVEQLRRDPHVRLVRAILAVPPDEVVDPGTTGFWIRLPRPVSVETLAACIEGVRAAN